MMAQIILVAVDGSEPAKNAAQAAIRLAAGLKWSIQGLYVVDELLVMDNFSNYQKELGRSEIASSRAELIEWFEVYGNGVLDELQSACGQAGVPVGTEIVFGRVPALIIDRAKQADLIAIGRKGRSQAADHAHLGRHFEHIAHHAHIPLIVGGDEAGEIDCLFAIYKGSADADHLFEWTARIQACLSTRVVVGEIMRGKNGREYEAIQGLMKVHQLQVSDQVDLDDEPVQCILEALNKSCANLALVQGYRHLELFDVLLGSEIDQILQNTHIPVFLI
jgi:nucleotide-binding universal stress UspA family protein